MTDPAPRRTLPQAAAAPTPSPFLLIGGHFALALLSLALGSALLPWVAADLARGDIFAPRTFAVVHLFSLGVLGSAILGALHQFYPMALGVPLRSRRVGYLGLAAWTSGLLLLICGFLAWRPALLGAGWVGIFIAVGAVSWNLLPARRRTRVPDGARIGAYVTAGHSCLGLAMAIGLARIGDAAGWWTTDRLGLVAAHFHLGVLGFGTLTAVGVGSRMIPMFLLTGPTPSTPLRWIGPSLVAGLLIQGTGLVAGWPAVAALGSALLFGSALAIGLLLVRWWGKRNRPLNGGLQLIPAATLWLFAATALGVIALLVPERSFRLWGAYALAGLLGWLILLVLGVLFRILPHISYLRLFGRRGGPVVPVDQVVHAGWTEAAGALLPVALAILVGGVLLGSPAVAVTGGTVWLLGAALVLAVYVRMILLAYLPRLAGETSPASETP
ncbi:MAG TPA: hypothetical protein VG940_06880 [Gemmatimonadales bacterium]|nr:hypothetical protein [Gemmatimonadales bacterium]